MRVLEWLLTTFGAIALLWLLPELLRPSVWRGIWLWVSSVSRQVLSRLRREPLRLPSSQATERRDSMPSDDDPDTTTPYPPTGGHLKPTKW